MNNLYIKGLVCLTAGSTSGSDPISKCFNIIYKLVQPISGQIKILSAVVLIVSGIMVMAPIPKKYKLMAGSFLACLIIGALLVAGASDYGDFINDNMNF